MNEKQLTNMSEELRSQNENLLTLLENEKICHKANVITLEKVFFPLAMFLISFPSLHFFFVKNDRTFLKPERGKTFLKKSQKSWKKLCQNTSCKFFPFLTSPICFVISGIYPL